MPDDCVVGEVDGGWQLARTTLANERVAIERQLVRGQRRARPAAVGATARRASSMRARVGRGGRRRRRPPRPSACGARCGRSAGQGPGPESSVLKLVGVRSARTPPSWRSTCCATDVLLGTRRGTRGGARGAGHPVPEHRRGHDPGAPQRRRRADPRPAPRLTLLPVALLAGSGRDGDDRPALLLVERLDGDVDLAVGPLDRGRLLGLVERADVVPSSGDLG